MVVEEERRTAGEGAEERAHARRGEQPEREQGDEEEFHVPDVRGPGTTGTHIVCDRRARLPNVRGV